MPAAEAADHAATGSDEHLDERVGDGPRDEELAETGTGEARLVPDKPAPPPCATGLPFPRMGKKVALFWPGDARAKPNELAQPSIVEATAQIERALKKLGASRT